MAIERTINQTPYSRNDFVRMIASTVGTIARENGVGANVNEIVDHWGDPQWQTPEGKHKIAQELHRLADVRKSPVLHKAEGHRGRYIVAPSYLRYGLTTAESVERSILPDMIAAGGFMTYTAIRQAFGIDSRIATPKVPVEVRKTRSGRKAYLTEKEREDRQFYSEVDTLDTSLRQQLARCTLVHRVPRGRNLFQLHGDLLNLIILEGRHVDKVMWQTLATVSRRSKKDLATRDLIDLHQKWQGDHFFNVGAAYREVRKTLGFDIEEVASHAGVTSVLETLACNHPSREAWLAFTEKRKPDQRWTRDELRPQAFFVHRWDQPRHWPAVVLALFEEGDPLTHQAAPADLHRQLSAHYDTDPVAMSRGTIARQPEINRTDNPLLRLFSQRPQREAPVGGEN